MGSDALAVLFEEHRPHLRAVSYRMLGSFSEADDAVQEAWLRLSRGDVHGVENLGGWLTTVISRVCLNMLRSRRARREEPFGPGVPDPVVGAVSEDDPALQAELVDSVGLALLVVLDTLTPAERLAFVLHDLFAVPFDEIAPIVDRTPTATRQLASRARRRVRASSPAGDTDLARQREVVDAFLAAAREGDFARLVATLDPQAVLRADTGPGRLQTLRGAEAIAEQALMFTRLEGAGAQSRPAAVNGGAGVVSYHAGRPAAILGFTVAKDRIVAINILADPERVQRLDLSRLES